MKCALLFPLAFCIVLASHFTARSEPFATAFTYQAQLAQGGSPLNASVDLRFDLFAVDSGDMPIAPTVPFTNLAITDGLVTVGLDFSVDVFDGSARWLQVAVRSPHDSSNMAPFTTLTPRQPISPIPYALQTRGMFVDSNGQVSIGATPTRSTRGSGPKVRVIAEMDETIALEAKATATSGDSVGVKGTTASPAGRGIEGSGPTKGVLGLASAMFGATIGVEGKSDSNAGIGVAGEAFAEGVQGKATGPGGKGVCGIIEASTGDGVLGHAMAMTGTTIGVHGDSDADNGTGVFGEAALEGVRGKATGPGGKGVCGIVEASTGDGVLGHASAMMGTTTGVHGMSDSPAGTGVSGLGGAVGVRGDATAPGGTGAMALASTAGSKALEAENLSPDGIAILAKATALVGPTIGIRAECPSPDGFAGYFRGRGYFSGFVGIGDFPPTGDFDPQAPLHVIGQDTAPNSRTMIVESDSSEGTWLSLRNKSSGGHDWNLVSADGPGPGGGKLRFVDDPAGLGVARMVIDRTGTGRVGIATESPTTTLDVNGTCKMTGFQLTAGGPLSGKVLTSNASGVGTWQSLPPASGGWTTIGNAGTNPSSNFLGTTDNQGLSLRTNNSVRVTIESGGNIGIGTESPTAKLHVGGTAGVDGIRFPDGTLQTTSGGGAIAAWSLTGSPGTSPGTNFLGTTDNQALQFHVNGARALRIEPNATSPNLIGGYSGNTAAPGVVGATIGGGGALGNLNTAAANYATVGGGYNNTAGGDYATVVGGYSNSASGDFSTVGGGPLNSASGLSSSVWGGDQNSASGEFAVVPGGLFNLAGGSNSFAAGRSAKVRDAAASGDSNGDEGTFIWSDNTGSNFNSTGPNQFLIRASGGVGIGTNAPAHPLHMASGAHCTTGGVWTDSSDRNAKENFEPLSARSVLDRLAKLPITRWNFKVQEPAIRHIGPVAQDFYAAFGTGEDDRHLAPLDTAGVALAAIQGLYEIVQEKDCRIEELEAKLSSVQELEAKVTSLEALVVKLASQHDAGGR